jgi:hypothetical protein
MGRQRAFLEQQPADPERRLTVYLEYRDRIDPVGESSAFMRDMVARNAALIGGCEGQIVRLREVLASLPM